MNDKLEVDKLIKQAKEQLEDYVSVQAPTSEEIAKNSDRWNQRYGDLEEKEGNHVGMSNRIAVSLLTISEELTKIAKELITHRSTEDIYVEPSSRCKNKEYNTAPSEPEFGVILEDKVKEPYTDIPHEEPTPMTEQEVQILELLGTEEGRLIRLDEIGMYTQIVTFAKKTGKSLDELDAIVVSGMGLGVFPRTTLTDEYPRYPYTDIFSEGIAEEEEEEEEEEVKDSAPERPIVVDAPAKDIRDKEIARRYALGSSPKHIAETVGTSISTVYRVIRELR